MAYELLSQSRKLNKRGRGVGGGVGWGGVLLVRAKGTLIRDPRVWGSNSEIVWHLGRNAWVRDCMAKIVRMTQNAWELVDLILWNLSSIWKISPFRLETTLMIGYFFKFQYVTDNDNFIPVKTELQIDIQSCKCSGGKFHSSLCIRPSY